MLLPPLYTNEQNKTNTSSKTNKTRNALPSRRFDDVIFLICNFPRVLAGIIGNVMMAEPDETEISTKIPAKLSRPRRSSAELASRTWASQKAEKKTKEKQVSSC